MFRSTRRAARVSSMHSLRHRLFVERLEDRTTPSTFTVVNTNDTTDTNDPGYVGSLRWAIGQANADADPLSTINFNIAAPGVQTISVASALPMIEHSVVINGYSQPGTSANTHHMDEPNPGNDPNYRSDNANLLIRIDGTLSITGGGSTVEGLIVRNIRISGGGGNTIAGDFIGTDGDLVLVGGGIGVSINGASNNTIGGTTPDSRNLIVARDTSTDLGPSSDLGAGIRTLSSSGNIIQGNFIGLDRTGKNVITAPGSWSYGIFVNGFLGGSDNNTIGGTTPEERNVISGWGLNQIVMSFSQGHKVQGNYIGTDAYGHAPNLPPRNPALYPASYGPYYGNVGIFDATGANNFIGGTTSGAGNLVGGQQFGIYVNNDGVNVVATGIDVVQGNVVGIGPTGLGLPNGEGIGGAGSLIGGTKDGAKNIVAGNNGSGIGASGGMLIEGNDVHDNGGAGVQVGGTGVTIQDNSIHANAGPGVWLTADPFGPANPFGYESSGYADATEVRIERNFIYANVGLGIALGDIAVDASGNPLTLDQVIANFDSNPDLWDHDIPNNTVVLNDSRGHVGPNNWQNFPVIAATRAGTTTYVQGSLHSTANATFTLDFYANSVADPSGYGQGQRWLGSADITTDGSGNVTFDSDQFSALLGASSLGEWITATATDANGNTSEFSPAFKLNDLAIYGTAGADAISLSGAGGGAVQIVDNGVSHTYTVPGQIFVFGQGGGDTYTVNFGSNLATPITLVGSGDASGDVLVVNGDNSSTNVITKTTDQLTWGSPVTETVYRSGIPNTTINANGTSNNYVNDPGGNTVINGGPGANTIVVTASSGTGIVINGGSSTNTYIVDLGSLAGPITINNSNTTASDNLVVNGAAGDNTITASGSQVTAGTQTINVAAPLTSATINGGSGSNQITVSNLTVAVQSLTLDGGGGNNTITLVNASADIGSLAINGGSNTGTNQVQVQGSVPATVSVQNITPVATILDGFLFEDFNDDGQI
ncbi:MAG: beta strand repeat-containing protein, partial [Gemmataceae bacterium]